MPEITVLMSTYKEKIDYLKLAIESILKQTFKDFEFIIIVDNPDNKKHIELLKKYENIDSRIKLFINKENLGLALTLNKGIELASGKYIARMDADDISVEDRLEKEYQYLQNNPNVVIVATNEIDINQDGEVIKYGKDLPENYNEICRIMKYVSIINHPSVMFRKKEIINIGMYRNFPTAQDYDLWLRAISNDMKIHLINEYLIKYRISDENISHKKALQQWLCSKYQKKLLRERIYKNKDSFSKENLEMYLKLNNYYDKKNQIKFEQAKKKFELANKLIHEKKIVKAMINLIISMFMHKEIKYILGNLICAKLIKSVSK